MSTHAMYYAVIIGKHPGIYQGNKAKKGGIGGLSAGFSKKFSSRNKAQTYWNSADADALRKAYCTRHPDGHAYCDKALLEAPERQAMKAKAKQVLAAEKKQCDKCPVAVSHNIDSVSILGHSSSTVMTAYTDGSCDPKAKLSGYSVVIPETDGTMVTIRGAVSGQKTCSTDAEVAAAHRAVEEAKRRGCTALVLHYDCAAVPSNLEAHPEWTKGLAVILVKVKAHSCDTYNNAADRAAKLALKERKAQAMQ